MLAAAVYDVSIRLLEKVDRTSFGVSIFRGTYRKSQARYVGAYGWLEGTAPSHVKGYYADSRASLIRSAASQSHGGVRYLAYAARLCPKRSRASRRAFKVPDADQAEEQSSKLVWRGRLLLYRHPWMTLIDPLRSDDLLQTGQSAESSFCETECP